MTPRTYVGRFAPSPSGPLHFGSLVCALASYLDAKAHHGAWLLRIEDIDPPREKTGAKDAILNTLDTHGLHWDGPVIFQSQRSQRYLKILDTLKNAALIYRCSCNRKRLAQIRQNLGISYDQHCLSAPPKKDAEAALRLNLNKLVKDFALEKHFSEFTDLIQGKQSSRLHEGDFVVHRKDGLFAYNFAVVVDDLDQGITHIVRGSDLLETTSQQIAVSAAITHSNTQHTFAHIPVVVDESGKKLSKQNHAPALDDSCPEANLFKAMRSLHLDPPNLGSRSQLLQWATENWDISRLRGQATTHIS